MRILALIPGGISDQILFFPTLSDLKQKYPDSMIDVIVEPSAKAAYRVCPHIHEVLPFDFQDRNGLADYLNLLGVIRDREYDIALTLAQSWAIEFLLWLNGIPVRVGYKTNASFFLSNAVPLKTEQYIPQIYHDLLQGLDIQSPCPSLTVTLPKEDIEWAEAEQKRLDVKESGYLLIHGGAKGSQPAQVQGMEQVYPISQLQTIIDQIQQKQANLPIVLLQGLENAQWVRSMIESRPNLRVTKPGDIGKLAAIIAGANLMLCTEGTPMHLSVAVGTYTIALFASSQAKKLLPPNQERYIAIESSTGNIADIAPENVLEIMWRS